MTHLQIFIVLIIVSSGLAFLNGKRVEKEGHSFGKTFFFTLIACIGAFFAIIKFLNN